MSYPAAAFRLVMGNCREWPAFPGGSLRTKLEAAPGIRLMKPSRGPVADETGNI